MFKQLVNTQTSNLVYSPSLRSNLSIDQVESLCVFNCFYTIDWSICLLSPPCRCTFVLNNNISHTFISTGVRRNFTVNYRLDNCIEVGSLRAIQQVCENLMVVFFKVSERRPVVLCIMYIRWPQTSIWIYLSLLKNVSIPLHLINYQSKYRLQTSVV